MYLDSESEEILGFAPYLDYIPLKRDAALATNKTDGHQLFYNEIKQVCADIYIQILCTSPFIKPETIETGIDILLSHPEYDSVVLVKKEKQYLWDGEQPTYDKNRIPNSVDLPDTVIETMGLYIIRGECALKQKMRYGNRVYLLEAQPIEAIDINSPEDLSLADYVARGIRAQETTHFKTIASTLNSALLADILHDEGINGIITGFDTNLSDAKVLARANTIKIRQRHDGEDYKGIYDALKTYKMIGEGEIIIVENEVPGYAYFGELNANLAIRSGACGAIIGGMTRDTSEVIRLGLPVFSKGCSCSDIKGKGVMESHNIPIEINTVKIVPGDLVFADRDGIVVIPQKAEHDILQKAMNAIRKEKAVLEKVVLEIDAYTIYQSEGEF